MATASEDERPPRKGIRRGIYLIPSTFTMGNILCGFYAVVDSLKGYQSIHNPERAAELFDHAAVAIGIAFLLDGLDGRIARMTKTTSEFGIELDSIADVLSFGIAPALLAYAWGYGSTPGIERLAWGVSFFFLVCGALRLARFNVLARAPRFTSTGTSPKLNKRYYVGLPIPSAAALIAALAHFGPRPINTYDPSQTQLLSWLLLVTGRHPGDSHGQHHPVRQFQGPGSPKQFSLHCAAVSRCDSGQHLVLLEMGASYSGDNLCCARHFKQSLESAPPPAAPMDR